MNWQWPGAIVEAIESRVGRLSTFVLVVGASALLALAVGSPGHGSASASQGVALATPRTVVSVAGSIAAFAQDGDRIAWLRPTGRCSASVRLRDLATGVEQALTTKGGATCRRRNLVRGYSPMLALAGTRALWGVFTASISHRQLYLVTGAIGPRRDRAVAELESDCDPCRGAPVVPLAGDGRTLVYVWGRVRRVVGARVVPVPGTRPTGGVIAAAGTTVGFARYVGSDYSAQARWSPDGKRLAFASGRDYGNPSLYVVNATGKGLVNLTGDSYVVRPSWSPDGGKLAFVTAENVSWSLWTIDTVTRGKKRLAGDVYTGSLPAWSPDGSTLAFARLDESVGRGVYRIYTVRASGGGERHVADGQDPSWSPDGSKIVFTEDTGFPPSGRQVEVVNADGTGGTVLADSGSSPTFSPDGSRIVFQRGGDIWVMKADGSGQTRLTDGPEPELSPRWSPDGGRIAFEHGERPQITVMNADGSSQRALAASTMADRDPDWSPDGTRIVFARERPSRGRVNTELWIVKIDGSEVRRVVAGASSRVEIRAATGALRRIVLAAGQVQALALSRSIVAVLGVDVLGEHLSVYGRATGSRLGEWTVSPSVAPELSAAGKEVVFRSGRTIWLLESSTHRLRRLAVAQARPIGLSIEGGRVAWAESLGGRARIRAVFLGA